MPEGRCLRPSSALFFPLRASAALLVGQAGDEVGEKVCRRRREVGQSDRDKLFAAAFFGPKFFADAVPDGNQTRGADHLENLAWAVAAHLFRSSDHHHQSSATVCFNPSQFFHFLSPLARPRPCGPTPRGPKCFVEASEYNFRTRMLSCTDGHRKNIH